MKKLPAFFSILFLLSGIFQACTKNEKERVQDYPVTPIDFTSVRLLEGFWKNWINIASFSTIPASFEKCKETGRIDNFIFAGSIREGRFRGRFGFDDSDVYKIMEGAAYTLMLEENPEMEDYLDTLISYITAAQEDDGYLYTAWTLKAWEYIQNIWCIPSVQGRWIATADASHEFYNAGHMYEAAVAHYLATGKKSFLDVAIKNADLVYEVCITKRNMYASGHQEIEIGLIKLFRVTGEMKYLELAKHLLDIRSEVRDSKYAQYHLPVTEQTEAVGHAVRANYMYTAMADIAALTGDTAYLEAVKTIWKNVISKKLSITGGVGASHEGEAYGKNYDLPNDPYNETCAAIANVYWNHRMFLLTGESKYMDVLERTLYNGVLSGLSLDGTHFFYPNTLHHDGVTPFNRGSLERSPWFDCSCCPSNLSRFIPSIASYAYAEKGNEIYVNLFLNSEVSVESKKEILNIRQETAYPWDGTTELQIETDKKVNAVIHIRIPGWLTDQPVPSDLFQFINKADSKAVIRVNGKQVQTEYNNGYAVLKKKWTNGDRIGIVFPMAARIISAHPEVKAKQNLLAVQYGPIVYCAEEIDNTQDVLKVEINRDQKFEVQFHERMLGGINTLKSLDLILIPYYAWGNRGNCKMNVWFDERD